MDSLRGSTLNSLEKYILSRGEKKYRAKQVYDFLFRTQNTSWENLQNVPKKLLECLREDYSFTSLNLIKRIASDKDITTKYLYETHDGKRTESVIIRKKDRITACLSSQVGCKFACRFCISGSQGLIRHLSASEIVDQYFMMQQQEGERITNLVMMGMGEPFDNYDAMIQAIRIIHSKEGFGLGARHITISTVGVPEGIERFANEGLDQIKLALSLHAPNDTLRQKLMPVNRKWDIESVIKTLEKNRRAFKRSITFEYILFGNLNDTPEHAKELAALARRIKAKVNLIRYNPTGFGLEGVPFQATTLDRMRVFREVLDRAKIVNTLRKSGGSDVGAACGQLSLGKK